MMTFHFLKVLTGLYGRNKHASSFPAWHPLQLSHPPGVLQRLYVFVSRCLLRYQTTCLKNAVSRKQAVLRSGFGRELVRATESQCLPEIANTHINRDLKGFLTYDFVLQRRDMPCWCTTATLARRHESSRAKAVQDAKPQNKRVSQAHRP